MRNKESGSAHVVIIIVLVVALLGALGFVFYQNFIVKKDASTTSTTTSQTKSSDTTTKITQPATKTLVMNTVFTNGLSLKYPETWTVTHEASQGTIPPTENDITSDRYTLKSPDGTVGLYVTQSSGGGFGGTCAPEDSPTLTTYSYEISPIWSAKSYADYISPYNGEYSVSQLLGDADTAKAIVAGDSACKISFLNLTDTGKTVGSSSKITLRTGVTLNGSPDGMSYATVAAAKAYLTSQNATDVKSILLSLK